MRFQDLPKKWREEGLRIRRIYVATTAAAAVLSLGVLLTIQNGWQTLQRQIDLPSGEFDAIRTLMRREATLVLLLLAVVLLMLLSMHFLVLRPLREYIDRIQAADTLPQRGAHELRYLARAYNAAYYEGRKHNDHLLYQAEHDPLTGLFNRRAFDKLRETHRDDQLGLMLIDVDRFKHVNDTWGHDVGDKVLKKVADLLSRNFRTSDYPCRVGGDEFCVICTGVTPQAKEVLRKKVHTVRELLRDTSDGLPGVTLSVGVAFNVHCGPEDDVYRMADAALYQVKTLGRDGCAFYDETIPPESGQDKTQRNQRQTA